MYLADYINRHGDPATNGKGHSQTRMNNQDIVIIPGDKIGKLRRSNIVQADLESTMAVDSGCLTGEDQLESMQEAIMQGMFSGPSTGVSLDSLMAPARAPSAPASAPPAQSPGSIPESSGSWLDRLGGGGGGSPPKPSQSSTGAPAQMPNRLPSQELIEPPPPQQGQGRKRPAAGKGKKTGPQPEGSAEDLSGKGNPKTPQNKKRGRPSVDRISKADAVLDDIAKCGRDNATWFGTGKVASMKSLKRLQDHLESSAKEVGDLEIYNVVQNRVKRVSAAHELLKVYNHFGSSHKDFALMYDNQMHFLSMEPKVDNDFPPFFHLDRYLAWCSDASTEQFWKLVATEAMKKKGFKLDVVESLQIEVIHNKLLTIAKLPDVQSVVDTLRALVANLEFRNVGLPQSLLDDINMLAKLSSDGDDTDPDEIMKIAAEVEQYPHLSYLRRFPRGKDTGFPDSKTKTQISKRLSKR